MRKRKLVSKQAAMALKELCQNLSKSRLDHQHTRDDLQTELRRMHRKNKQLNDIIEQQNSQMRELNKVIKKSQKKLQQRNDKVARLQNQLLYLRKKAEEEAGSNAALGKRLQSAAKAMDDLQGKLKEGQEYKQRVIQLKYMLQNAQEQLIEQKLQKEKLIKQLSSHRQQTPTNQEQFLRRELVRLTRAKDQLIDRLLARLEQNDRLARELEKRLKQDEKDWLQVRRESIFKEIKKLLDIKHN